MITRSHLNLGLRRKILELVKENVKIRRIAQHLGLSRQTVWRIINLQQALVKQ